MTAKSFLSTQVTTGQIWISLDGPTGRHTVWSPDLCERMAVIWDGRDDAGTADAAELRFALYQLEQQELAA